MILNLSLVFSNWFLVGAHILLEVWLEGLGTRNVSEMVHEMKIKKLKTILSDFLKGVCFVQFLHLMVFLMQNSE